MRLMMMQPLPIGNEAAIAKGDLWLVQRTWVPCVE